eukprot:3668679-Prymnesium_polylepis.2
MVNFECDVASASDNSLQVKHVHSTATITLRLEAPPFSSSKRHARPKVKPGTSKRNQAPSLRANAGSAGGKMAT